MRSYLQTRLTAMGHARRGLRHLLSTESHARIHILATVIVFTAAAILGVSATNWGLLLLAIGLVWTAEAFNTAVERIVDLCSPETNDLAGQAKDVAAAGVMLAAMAATAVGLIVFVPAVLAFLRLR